MKNVILFCSLMLAAFFGIGTAQGQGTDIVVNVRTATDLEPIQEAEVSYFDQQGRRVPAGSTNSDGYLRLNVPFVPGDEVLIQVNKFGVFKTEKIRHRIGNNALGPNNINFYLRVFDGIKVTGHVYSSKKKSSNSLLQATLTVPNPTGEKEAYKTDFSGFFEFNTLFEAGQKVPVRIEAPGYFLQEEEVTLEVEGPRNNYFKFFVKPVPKINWCNCLLYGGGGLAAISIGSYFLSDGAYQNYLDFNNPERESDYDSANAFNRISFVTAGLAVIAGASGYICKKKEKKAREERLGATTSPIIGQGANGVLVGLRHNF